MHEPRYNGENIYAACQVAEHASVKHRQEVQFEEEASIHHHGRLHLRVPEALAAPQEERLQMCI